MAAAAARESPTAHLALWAQQAQVAAMRATEAEAAARARAREAVIARGGGGAARARSAERPPPAVLGQRWMAAVEMQARVAGGAAAGRGCRR